MTDELLSNSVTAQTLFEALPDKTLEQWTLWLQNNRNPARRTPYRIPYVKMGGGVFYRTEELEKYVEWEKARRLGSFKLSGRAAEALRAFGIGEAGGGTTGRKLNITTINPQVDSTSGLLYVQVITNEPLMVYRIEVDQAREIVRELTEAVAVCERGHT